MASGLTFFPHPLTPPTTEEDRLAWLRLIRSHRVGISTFFRLVAEHGGAPAALAALPAIAGAAGVSGYTPFARARAEAELAAGRRLGARLLCWSEADYPAELMAIPDPPPILWALGDLALLRRPRIALIGARNASSLGIRMATRLAVDLGAAGAVVVSGLARGIDAAAHAGALETGTIAVQGGGIDVLYPAENADLARRIAAQGLRLSEQPPGMEPLARHFPLRNRIIAGLSRAVVVVEAAARSGSLMTARLAAEQGREVMAVPGHPFDARATGCNLLIRDGATLVRGAEDVIAALSGSGSGPGAAAEETAPAASGRRGEQRERSQPGRREESGRDDHRQRAGDGEQREDRRDADRQDGDWRDGVPRDRDRQDGHRQDGDRDDRGGQDGDGDGDGPTVRPGAPKSIHPRMVASPTEGRPPGPAPTEATGSLPPRSAAVPSRDGAARSGPATSEPDTSHSTSSAPSHGGVLSGAGSVSADTSVSAAGAVSGGGTVSGGGDFSTSVASAERNVSSDGSAGSAAADSREAPVGRALRSGRAFASDGSGASTRARPPLASVSPPVSGGSSGTPVSAADLAQDILSRLGPSPLLEDHLIRDLACPVAAAVGAIVLLELDGALIRHPGGLISLAC